MKIIVKGIAAIAAVALIVMLIVPLNHPNILAPMTLAFGLTVIVNVVMLVLLLLCRSIKSSIVLALLLAISYPAARRTIVMHGAVDEPGEDDQVLTILTYNIEIFNNYKSVEQILSLIEEESPDVLCLQEFGHYYNNREKANNIMSSIGSIYPYRHLWYKNQNRGNENGLVLFSKYPIVNKQKLEYESAHNISVYSDIVVGDDTIRIINNHLESNRLSKREREISSNPTDTSTMKAIYKKIVVSSRIRADQADSVSALVEETRYPVIVVGDFNDVPQSYTYRHILYSENQCGESLHDAYADAGKRGMYHTYNQHHFNVALDHILYSKPIRAVEAKIIEVDYSDHYPVKATLVLGK